MSVDSLFIPTPNGGADEAAMVQQALACIDAFTESFNARDLAGMDAYLHFPHIILSGEKLVVWDTPGRLSPDFFTDLTYETGWDHTVYHDRRAVLVSPRKVHLLVEYSRNRADGSIITMHQNLWIVTDDGGRWGIKQRSY